MQVETNVQSTRGPAAFDPRIEVHPSMHDDFRAMGLTSPESFLDLPGEIVSGHPDRHVMRVVLANGTTAYLKKEHRIRWKDRCKNWRAGFGWSSKSVREGRTLQAMERLGIGAPSWLAFGEDGRGRAFVLNAAASNAVDLRQLIHSHSVDDDLAIRLGRFSAELHNAGIDHPDWYAKHFLIDPLNVAITLLDWQRTTIGRDVSWPRRILALAALAATMPLQLPARLRGRFLWAYRRVAAAQCKNVPSFAQLTRAIEKRVQMLEQRRGVREQRQPPLNANAQRLIWLDGEALCALPEVADDLRPNAARIALYDRSRDQSEWPLCFGRTACLRVGSHAGWWRGNSWRTPEVQLARLLFHLERHHIAAPRLLAFGQRRNGRRIEAFVLHDKPLRTLQRLDHALRHAHPFRRELLLERFADVLAKLHESGCEARTVACFAVDGDCGALTILVADPQRLVFRRHLSARRKSSDRARVIRSMHSYCGQEELARFAQVLEPNSNR